MPETVVRVLDRLLSTYFVGRQDWYLDSSSGISVLWFYDLGLEYPPSWAHQCVYNGKHWWFTKEELLEAMARRWGTDAVLKFILENEA